MYFRNKKQMLADGVKIGLEAISNKKSALFHSYEKYYREPPKKKFLNKVVREKVN